MPWGAWAAVADATRVVSDGEPVVLAFDSSASGDSTALVGCTVADAHVFVVDVWEHPADDPRWRVPRHDVDSAVDAAFARWNVLELSADPWGWRSEIETWAQRHGEQRVLEGTPGTRNAWPRQPTGITAALKRWGKPEFD